jgi:Fibronectin type III domain
MAYDVARGVTVLFGGVGCDRGCSDTWTWDGRQWAQQPVTGPGARSHASMVYDAARGVTVLFGGGGNGCDGPCGDTWTLGSAGLAPPSAPRSPQAVALGPGSVRLDWQGGGGETSFEIDDAGTGVAVKTVAAGTTSVTLVGLTPGTEYGAVVYAVNSAGYPEPSEQVCATTAPS